MKLPRKLKKKVKKFIRRSIAYDIALLPKELTGSDVINYYNNFGIIPINDPKTSTTVFVKYLPKKKRMSKDELYDEYKVFYIKQRISWMKKNHCNRCKKVMPISKWWLCDECDKKQP